MAEDLLDADEPGPAIVRAGAPGCPFVLVADHAGNAIPRTLGDLGLGEADRRRHIAWDIGIAGVAEALAEKLGAPLVRQRYSRLVIDCNRDPARADAIPAISDDSVIAGNAGLAGAARAARVAAIHTPYHAAIAAALAGQTRPPILVALHSFTPAMSGRARPWHAGVLHDRGDTRFSGAVLAGLRARLDAPVGDNEPYAMDGIDFTVPHHCYAAERAYAEIEIRQDLIAEAAGQVRWASLLADVLTGALSGCGRT
ncbi:N-formylglutamate amidohydrolase [Novosphingobium sp. Gsoil 351]|uniref:N-formylglutamate amidohydrolase n=1 Tax=Novosphingobium sp. Gsoil 351 TaxID=2675225 RepID=UPI0012B4D468|nr:N-formylglutamate amidohydrolase [Novosphingobium sp. Gsoil 351]QGN55396.1 N-formylglutamate amidohydrolase [Novosphingobium sp. Gsoil 351]